MSVTDENGTVAGASQPIPTATGNVQGSITTDASTPDHDSRSDSDQKIGEEDVSKKGKPESTPQRSKKKIALIMTALSVRCP